MSVSGVAQARVREPVRLSNVRGAGPYIVVCDHASNWLPPEFGTLGLDQSELTRHIAWDPGALPVATLLAGRLDAPLVESCVSRLVIDCNRPPEAPDAIPELSETTAVPGNRALSAEQRAARAALSHRPFHDALAGLIEERLAAGHQVRLLTIHSFTPVFKGVARPWEIGVIHDEDERLARPLLAGLRNLPGLTVGDNEPYSPADRVYYTLERHARRRNLPCVMIEIRNDEIRDAEAQRAWAERLAAILSGIQEPDLNDGAETASSAKEVRDHA